MTQFAFDSICWAFQWDLSSLIADCSGLSTLTDWSTSVSRRQSPVKWRDRNTVHFHKIFCENLLWKKNRTIANWKIELKVTREAIKYYSESDVIETFSQFLFSVKRKIVWKFKRNTFENWKKATKKFVKVGFWWKKHFLKFFSGKTLWRNSWK